jgi:hypothetical protein
MEEECLGMLRAFFRDLRAKKKADPDDSGDGTPGIAEDPASM